MEFEKLINKLLQANVELQAEIQKNLCNTNNQTDDDDNDGLELARLLGDVAFLWAHAQKIKERQKKEIQKVDAAADALECRMAMQDLENWLLFDRMKSVISVIRLKYRKRLPEEIQEVLSEIEENVVKMLEWERKLQVIAEKKYDSLRKKEYPEISVPVQREKEMEEPEEEWEIDEWER